MDQVGKVWWCGKNVVSLQKETKPVQEKGMSRAAEEGSNPFEE
jgi:hypothetical protein